MKRWNGDSILRSERSFRGNIMMGKEWFQVWWGQWWWSASSNFHVHQEKEQSRLGMGDMRRWCRWWCSSWSYWVAVEYSMRETDGANFFFHPFFSPFYPPLLLYEEWQWEGRRTTLWYAILSLLLSYLAPNESPERLRSSFLSASLQFVPGLLYCLPSWIFLFLLHHECHHHSRRQQHHRHHHRDHHPLVSRRRMRRGGKTTAMIPRVFWFRCPESMWWSPPPETLRYVKS